MNSILLIECGDQKGLVHMITGVLYKLDCNILAQGEFVDREHGRFFIRTEFSGGYNKEELIRLLGEILPADAEIRLPERRKKRLVLLASKEHHCLGDLLHRNLYGEMKGEVSAVISNHENLQALADRYDIPFYCIPHHGISRERHEEEITKRLDILSPDYIILAKYMRIFTPSFVRRYRNSIVNIHHSFLPAFIGANPYKQAYERGVKIIGATAHFVTDDLDEGPIVAQSVIPVDHTHGAEDMARAGRDVEKIVLARALNLIFEDRVFINRNKTVIFD